MLAILLVGLLAPPLVGFIAILAAERVRKKNLKRKPQGIAAEEFFSLPVFGAPAGEQNLGAAVRADDFAAFDAVNHLQQEKKSQARTCNINESHVLMVASKGKGNQARHKQNHMKYHKQGKEKKPFPVQKPMSVSGHACIDCSEDR